MSGAQPNCQATHPPDVYRLASRWAGAGQACTAHLVEGEGLHVNVVRRALRAGVRDGHRHRPLVLVQAAPPLRAHGNCQC